MEGLSGEKLPAKTINKELIFFLVTLVFFLVVVVIYVLMFLRSNNNSSKVVERPDTPFYTIDPATKEVTELKTKPAETILTDLEFKNEFNPLGLVLKGYAESANPNNGELKVKNKLLNSEVLQLLTFNTTHLKELYCWPATIPGKNGPIDITTLEIGLSSPESTIFNPAEKTAPIDQLDTFVVPNTYVIIQLEKAFDINQTNFIKKLVVVGC